MTEWIDIELEVPKEFEKVLSYAPNDYEKIRIDYIVYASNRFIWACRSLSDDNRYKVTHWMPLPLLPEDKK